MAGGVLDRVLDRLSTLNNASSSGVASTAFAVTPHNSTDFATPARGLYVGTTGNVVVVTTTGAVTFTAVPAGAILPVECTRVNSTGTTASNIVGLV